MSAIRQEILDYINNIPDSKLRALKPILTLLADETLVIDTDLTDEEKAIVLKGRDEYKQGNFVVMDTLLW